MEELAEEPAELVARVAALDIGKASLVCCVRVPHETRPGARRQEVRTYDTVTPALLELRDWLICQGVTRVVMEATSACWKPPFYLLEDDIQCWVVNARDVKDQLDLGNAPPQRTPGSAICRCSILPRPLMASALVNCSRQRPLRPQEHCQ